MAAKANEDEPAGRLASILRIGVLAGVVIIGAVSGYAVKNLVTASAETPAIEEDQEAEGAGEQEYYDFEPVTVTLNTRQKDRYLRATITLALAKKTFSKTAPLIDSKKPLLKDKLITYLSGLGLADVGDSAHLNKIRREILQTFNQALWPDEKPQIDHLLFKEFALQ